MNCVSCQTPIPDGSRFCPSCGADTSAPGSSSRREPGSSGELFEHLKTVVAGRYDVKKLLGRGGMGAVFLATDSALDRLVAIKVPPPELSHDEKFVQRFEHEARTAAKLDHPNITPIFAVEGQADLHYFVMKYVTGRGLDEILDAGLMPVDVAQRILWEAAVALGHAHQRGIAHRDIKPANIMIDDQGRTMLTDFGISKALESASQFTATGQVIGTPHYMSPEQAKGQEIDGRTDQYSLAVVGYRMFTGRLPFEDQSVHTVIYKHIFEEPPPVTSLRQDLPAELATALHKAMAKDPDHRYATMEEFATAIWPEHPVARPSASSSFPTRSAVSALPSAVTEVTPAPAPSKRGRRARAAGITLLLLGAGAGGAWWWFGGTGLLGRGEVEQPTTTRGAIGDTVGAGEQALGGPLAAAGTTVTEQAAGGGQQEPAGIETQPRTPPTTPARRQTPSRPPRSPRPSRRTEVAPRVGFLTVGANPFGTVYIDGVKIRDTPVFKYELRPSRYVIEIRRVGYQTMVDTVSITSGNTTRLNKTLIRVP